MMLNGPAMQQPLTPNYTAIRRQGITNLTCRDSSWLTANPAFIFNKMSDAAFKTYYHLRHMFPVLGSHKFCICRTQTDCFGDHASGITVRNQTRNTAHSDASQALRNAVQHYLLLFKLHVPSVSSLREIWHLPPTVKVGNRKTWCFCWLWQRCCI